jgi:hypothetical protein
MMIMAYRNEHENHFSGAAGFIGFHPGKKLPLLSMTRKYSLRPGMVQLVCASKGVNYYVKKCKKPFHIYATLQ